MDDLQDLTTREMQAYGALCLHRFCKAKKIKHKSIGELIDHLLFMLIVPSFDQWDDKLRLLELDGLGWQPIPESLNDLLSEELRESFPSFIYDVVNIGFCDMYGAASSKSLKYLMKTLAFLDKYGVKRPDVTDLFKNRTPRGETNPEWGNAYTREQYKQVRRSFPRNSKD
jgi:hypothetical protein